MRERGFVAEPFGVVAGGGEQLAGDVEADTLEGEQDRGKRGDQDVEVVIELGELVVESLDALGDAGQGPLGRRRGIEEAAGSGWGA